MISVTLAFRLLHSAPISFCTLIGPYYLSLFTAPSFVPFSLPIHSSCPLSRRSSDTPLHPRNSPVPIYFDISRLTLSNPFFFGIDLLSFLRSSFMSKTCTHFLSLLPSQSIIISVMCLRFPCYLSYILQYIYSYRN